ncbi:unnamed protein product [Cyclocybe aegerita]|uniref:Reverse transcriptase domain-containing protein n=1 Tax=Cyclocybe aegerita TaxID=1973307 RepID=A0A8S0X7U3_CYCAE|nr:unnamed protein product [Cyclocybe aegerita]
MFIPKPVKPGQEPDVRNPLDLRPRNKNTKKLSSPLPEIEGITRRVAAKTYRSMLDLKDAYEQMCIDPKDVWKTAFATPQGNMVSNVVQIGDCNAPATFQALMNHIFSPYIGIFMDVYLDDIIIYSDTLEEHIEHVKLVLDVLKREKFYLSANKLNFLSKRVKILGRIVDEEGIQMDPHKVDALSRWKTPTNRDLLRGFLGAAGYLADDIDHVRIPMGVLHSLTSDSVPFQWGEMQQRAFDEIKELAVKCKDHHRKPLKYGKDAPHINVMTDGCATGIAGIVSQGEDWKKADVAAFFSAKLSPVQQNYAVHKIELLAGVETMLRHRDILQGTHFRWFTDHKGLIHLLKQRNLSGRQARWMEKISIFDFEVVYVPGVENILSDALSRIYSNDAPGTVRALSEYTEHNDSGMPMSERALKVISAPVLVGLEGEVATFAVNYVRRKNKKATNSPAETGRPETAEEFAARVGDSFVLHGPCERTEGEGQKDQGTSANQSDPNQKLVIRIPARKKKDNVSQSDSERVSKISALETEPRAPSDTSENAETDLVEAPQMLDKIPQLDITKDMAGIDVLNEIRHKYGQDTVFKTVIEKPTKHRNFILEDGLVFLKDDSRKRLCIPDLRVQGRSYKQNL